MMIKSEKREFRPGWCPVTSTTGVPEKGGELMEVYTLEVEVLEDKLAPIGIRIGGE
ncbi:MAG TPA: hypothetical protein VM118_03835 [Acidobacteriota bacterium]|nr:hypothetical protein [Acidobacteriota bacterium]